MLICLKYIWCSETKECGKLKKVKNGKATLDIKATSTVGSTASIRCKSGFEADREKITCLETGEWEEATCNKQGLLFLFAS
jgi:hypothetical protein